MQAGLMNTYQRPISSRQTVAWFLSGLLTLSYLLLYLGPIPALGMRWDVFQAGAEAVGLKSKWTLYGLLYTLAMIAGGAYVIRRHGSSRYQLIRTSVVVLVQITFGFSLPIVMKVFGQQEYYFSYFWPLKIEYLYPSTILGQPFLILAWSFLGSLVAFPLLAYFFGKRFYCSWVCGCGGLANTAGEPFRHLSSKSPRAWKVEQVSIYSVLFLALVTTAIVWVNWAIGKQHPDFARFQPGQGLPMSYDDLKVIEASIFLQSVADGLQRAPGVAEMLDTARVCDAVTRSCETGVWETCTT